MEYDNNNPQPDQTINQTTEQPTNQTDKRGQFNNRQTEKNIQYMNDRWTNEGCRERESERERERESELVSNAA